MVIFKGLNPTYCYVGRGINGELRKQALDFMNNKFLASHQLMFFLLPLYQFF